MLIISRLKKSGRWLIMTKFGAIPVALWISIVVVANILPNLWLSEKTEICAICGAWHETYSLHLGPFSLLKWSRTRVQEETSYVIEELEYVHKHEWIWNSLNEYRRYGVFADAFASRRIPITYIGVLDGLKKIKDRQKAIEIVNTMANQENKIRAVAGAVVYDLSRIDTSKWTDADWKDWWKQNESYLQIVYDRKKAAQLIDKAKKDERLWFYAEKAEAHLIERH